jgi:hypothetical protein
MNTTTQQEPTTQVRFNNNPWTLAFDSLSRAFKINQNPAIAIIVGSIIMDTLTQGADESTRAGVLAFGVIFSLGFTLVSLFVATLWSGFTAHVGLKNAKAERTEVGLSLKAGLAKLWQVFAINFMVGLFGLLCFIPSIIVLIIGAVFMAMDQTGVAAGIFIASALLGAAGAFFAIRITFQRALSLFALYDENSGVFGSMSRSVALTKGRLMEIWGVSFTSIVPFVGELLKVCGLGSHYLQLKVYRDHNTEMPKVHILSWLPLFFVGGIALIVMLLGGLIALLAAAN